MARYPAVIVLIASLLSAVDATAQQRQMVLQTSEGNVTIESIDRFELEPFIDLFFGPHPPRPLGNIFHSSEKRLACDETTCDCIDFNCADCLNAMDPELTCADGLPAQCSCETGTLIYDCTASNGAAMICEDPPNPDVNATCTCGDGSTPAFECADLSPPPGTCQSNGFVVIDDTLRAGALRSGKHRLNLNSELVALPNVMPATLENQPGILQNGDLTVAFVREPFPSCLLTTEWIINLQDNSDEFDAIADCPVGAGGDAAYLVFARVVGSSEPLNIIASLTARDLTAEVVDGMGAQVLSCTPPAPPLVSWVPGMDDAIRCNEFDQFALIDLSTDPLPAIIGNCVPGDLTCLCPGGVPCVELALPPCLEVGAFNPVTETTPCFEPVCDDTQMGTNGVECTARLGPNFPLVIPEPGPGALTLTALMTLFALMARGELRRLTR